MSVLVDTHVWLWSVLVPERLGGEARRLLEDPDDVPWLSPISVWEFLLLVEKGRLRLEGDADPHRWLDEVARRAPLREAPLTHAIARESRVIDLPHEDPADRFLAATARVLDLTLLTADARLLGGSGYRVAAAGV